MRIEHCISNNTVLKRPELLVSITLKLFIQMNITTSSNEIDAISTWNSSNFEVISELFRLDRTIQECGHNILRPWGSSIN